MDEKPFETINVIPFVDVMLVLLAMVLTTANFIQTGRIPISLPQATRQQTDKHPDKTIELASDGTIYLEGKLIKKDVLESELKNLPAETGFLIRADRSLKLQQFIDVVDVLKRLKFTRVAVQTQSTEK
jgi:biopolymer transport protein ExbD